MEKPPLLLQALVFLIVALAGAWWVAWLTRPYGIGLSPDSAAYLSVARSLLQGEGWTTYEGAPLTVFPPLFPTLLAIVSGLFGIDPLIMGQPFQGFLWGSLIVVQFFLLKRFLPWRWAWLLSVLLWVARPMVQIFTMLWSEPLFLVLLSGLFILLALYAETPNMKNFTILVLVAALLPLTRYVGLVAVAWAILWVALLSPNNERLRRLLLFIIGAVLPVGGWLLRNLWLVGVPFGARQLRLYVEFIKPFRRSLYHIASWLLPTPLLSMKLFALLGIGIFTSMVYLGLRAFHTARWKLLFPIALFLSWSVLYLAVLIGSSGLIIFDLPDQRLLSPIFPSLIAFGGVFLYVLTQDATDVIRRFPRTGRWSRWSARMAWLIGLAIWLGMLNIHLAQLPKVIVPLRQGERGGWGWQSNPLLTQLRASAEEVQIVCDIIYSNAPWWVYVWGDFIPSRPLPSSEENIEAWWQKNGGTASCYLWLNGVSENFVTADTLAHIVPLQLWWQNEGGVFYRQK